MFVLENTIIANLCMSKIVKYYSYEKKENSFKQGLSVNRLSENPRK